MLVGQQTVEKRAVETVHGLAEAAEKQAPNQPYGCRIKDLWGLFHQGFGVGIATGDDLDVNDLLLLRLLVMIVTAVWGRNRLTRSKCSATAADLGCGRPDMVRLDRGVRPALCCVI